MRRDQDVPGHAHIRRCGKIKEPGGKNDHVSELIHRSTEGQSTGASRDRQILTPRTSEGVREADASSGGSQGRGIELDAGGQGDRAAQVNCSPRCGDIAIQGD